MIYRHLETKISLTSWKKPLFSISFSTLLFAVCNLHMLWKWVSWLPSQRVRNHIVVFISNLPTVMWWQPAHKAENTNKHSFPIPTLQVTHDFIGLCYICTLSFFFFPPHRKALAYLLSPSTESITHPSWPSLNFSKDLCQSVIQNTKINPCSETLLGVNCSVSPLTV